jgi:AcrR family transcriptional regulator
MPRTRTAYHHGALSTALLRTARKLLAARGPAALSLREVARRAGVSHQAPYRHYPDKEALLAALAAEGFRELSAAVEQAVRRHPACAIDQLAAAGVAYVKHGLKEPALYRLMFGYQPAAPVAASQQLQGDSRRAFAELQQIIERGQAAGEFRPDDPLILAVAAWCIVHGLTSLVIDERLPIAPGGGKRAAFLARICRLLVEGLR